METKVTSKQVLDSIPRPKETKDYLTTNEPQRNAEGFKSVRCSPQKWVKK